MKKVLAVVLCVALLVTSVPLTAILWSVIDGNNDIYIDDSAISEDVQGEDNDFNSTDDSQLNADDDKDDPNADLKQDIIENSYVEEIEEDGPDNDWISQVLTGEFDGRTVSVSGRMPKGVTLSLSAVSEESVDTIVEKMGQDNSVFACDIKILYPDGTEWQPGDDCVEVKITGIDVAEDKQLKFLHVSGDLEDVASKNEIEGEVDTIRPYRDVTGVHYFDAYSFSTYIGFTVEFHYQGETLSIGGGSSILLSELFAKFQIQKDAKDVVDVKFTNYDVIEVEQVEGDWLIKSTNAFSTKETLTVIFKNGEEVVIGVTDYSKTDIAYVGNRETGETGTTYSGVTVKHIVGDKTEGYQSTIDRVTISGTIADDTHLLLLVWTDFQLSAATDNGITVKNGTKLTVAARGNNHISIYDGNMDPSYSFIHVNSGGELTVIGNYTTLREKQNISDTFTKYTTVTDLAGTEPDDHIDFDGRNVTDYDNKPSTSADISGINTDRASRFVHVAGDTTYGNDDDGRVIFYGVNFANFSTSTTSAENPAVFINGDRDVDFYYCKFENITNRGTSEGAAIEFGADFGCKATDKDINIQHCEFIDCKNTGKSNGAAVYMHLEARDKNNKILANTVNELEFRYTTFTRCEAHRGGAIYINRKLNTLMLRDVTFTSCKATTISGGAVYLTENCTLNKLVTATAKSGKGITLINCTAYQNGGGLYFGGYIKDGQAVPSDGETDDNTHIDLKITASGCMAGIDASGTNTNDSTTGYGGAVYFNSNFKVPSGKNLVFQHVDGAEFVNCKARVGGAIAINDSKQINSFAVKGVDFEDCEAIPYTSGDGARTGGYGGAVYFDTDAKDLITFKPTNATSIVNTFTNCKAFSGAGVFVTSASSAKNLEFYNCVFTSCHSTQNYCAIRIGGTYTKEAGYGIIVSGNTFKDCQAGVATVETDTDDAQVARVTSNGDAAGIGITTNVLANYVSISGNTFKGLAVTGDYGGFCIYANFGNATVDVKQNTFTDCYAGFWATGSSDDDTRTYYPRIIEWDASGEDAEDNNDGVTDNENAGDGEVVETAVPDATDETTGADDGGDGGQTGAGTAVMPDTNVAFEGNGAAMGFNTNCRIGTLNLEGTHTINGTPGNTFVRCMSVKHGGAVYVNGKMKTANFTNLHFDQCASRNGSAVYLSSGATFQQLNVTGSEFSNNKNFWQRPINGEAGGTFRTTGAASLNAVFDNCYFHHNASAQNGAGIYWNAGGVTNEADYPGFGVASSKATVKNCTFKQNTALDAGGAIMCETFLDIENSTIYNNYAKRGAGICQQGYSNYKVPQFNAKDANGKYINMGTALVLGSGVVIEKNVARENGGGILLENIYSGIVFQRDTLQDKQDFYLKFEIPATSTGVEIKDNVAYKSGGGIAFLSREYLTENESYDPDTIFNNVDEFLNDPTSVPNDMRQAFVDLYKKDIDIAAGVIQGNQARDNGGGIYMESKNATVDVYGGEIYANKAGGVCNSPINEGQGVSADGQVIVKRVDTKGAETGVDGAVYDETLTVDGTATGNGGGVFVKGDGTKVNMYGGTIGKANPDTIAEPKRSDYTSDEEYQAAVDAFEESLHLYGNKADFGGGIAVNGGELVVQTGTDASGAITTPSIQRNSAVSGGGVMVLNGSNITVYEGNINNNHAEGKYDLLPGVTITEAQDKRFVGCGGGIYAAGGTFKLIGGTIDTNYATNGGGAGVFAALGGDVVVEGGFITNNVCNQTVDYENSTTAHNITSTRGYGGIGGGVCLADGVDSNNKSEFTIVKPQNGTEVKIGLFKNTAEFAADDVFASGNYTKLTVPALNEMDTTSGFGGVQPSGWFEDYPNYDTDYTLGLGMDKQNVGSRYRAEVEAHPRKYVFENVYNDVNTDNQYVCVTLGITTKGNLTITLKTQDQKGKDLRNIDNTEYRFQLLYGTVNSGVVEPYTYVKTSTQGEEHTLANGGIFTMKSGDTLSFTDIGVSTFRVAELRNGEVYQVYTVEISHTGTATMGTESFAGAEKTESAFQVGNGGEVNVNFVNVVRSMNVTLKYYDRKMVNGQPNDMNSEHSEFSAYYAADGMLGYLTAEANGDFAPGTMDFDGLITNTYEEFAHGLDNVVDEYHLWTSQKGAEAGVKQLAQTNATVAKKYANSNDCDSRANQYGIPQNKEEWLKYYDCDDNGGTWCKGSEIEPYQEYYDEYLTDVEVWLLNTPKEYTLTVHQDNGSGTTFKSVGDNTYVVENATPTTYNAYYNQRIGTSKDTAQDAATNHLRNYSISGYINRLIVTKGVTQYGGENLTFAYWSFDPEGKTIASTDIHYNYRITTDTTIYAVYRSGVVSELKGLTVSKNDPDIVADSNGTKIRLNTMMNVYGCEDSDKNIKNVSVIYILDKYGNDAAKKLGEDRISEIQAILADNLPTLAEDATRLQGAIPIDLKSDGTLALRTNGSTDEHVAQATYYVYFVDGFSDDPNASGDTILSNKNRNEFTITFSTSSVANKRFLTFAAMYYEGEGWMISDNYVDYTFNSNGTLVEN